MAVRLIAIEIDEAQRMRRVVSRSNCRVTGKYSSLKKGEMAYWESSIEHDAFRRLDADFSVTNFQEQPAKIIYEVDGARQIHYPDVLVEWRHQPKELVEIKTDRDAATEEVRERTAVLTKILPKFGFRYRVWTESQIRIQPRLATETFLLRYGRHPVPLLVLEQVRRIFEQEAVIPWKVLTNGTLGVCRLPQACRLVLDGHLQIDWAYALTPSTPVRFDMKGADK